MSGHHFTVRHSFCTGQPGRALVTLEVDGQLGAMWPDEADQLAAMLIEKAKLARTHEAPVKAQGAELLAATPHEGVA